MRMAITFCMLAVACGGPLPHATYAPQPTSALVSVARPPPPARVELVPACPSAAAVWVDGEWMWRRERWAWMPGRWVEAPAGSTFSPWVFVRAPDGGLWYAPGVWRDVKGVAIEAPAALAIGTVETGEVVNADGTTEPTGPTLHPGRVHASSRAP